VSGLRAVTLRAPAKVNLALHVLGRRADGFHDIETIFQAVDLCDEVRVERGREGVALEVVGPDLGPTEENLAYRAALAALDALGHEGGVAIKLRKSIPVGAGLGGGSSDAAAVLRCVLALAGPSPRSTDLHPLAAPLGSDVPFFVGQSALTVGRGRGERLEPVPALPPADMVLVSPPVHVPTAWAYAELSARREGRGDRPRRHHAVAPTSWEDVKSWAHNDFQALVSERYPEVARSLAALSSAGADLAMMSGSGSTSFGVFRGPSAAREAAGHLAGELGWPCTPVRTLSVLPAPELE
jgi:4-diphosphocytidyl-2-C-methyl-D-erythritol kinase